MTKSNPFHEYVMNEVFYELDGVTSRPMFGGFGIYKDGIFFALIDQDNLYFKVDETTRKDFENAGSKQFTYPMKDRKLSRLNYWELPESIIEDREELEKWVEKSVKVATNSKKKPRP